MAHLYLVLKLVHVIGGAVLFGTGLSIAFFMVMAHRSGDPAAVAHTTRAVVVADALFTATAVVVLPLTGWALAAMSGLSINLLWIKATLVLYAFVGVCWLPVVWIQLRLRDLSAAAVQDETQLTARYHLYFRVWYWLGSPAFAGILAIFVLMLWKPK
jgi:uncharacterized membrane protein